MLRRDRTVFSWKLISKEVHYSWCLAPLWGRPLLLIEAAQSRPPSSLGLSDSADNVGRRTTTSCWRMRTTRPPPCCMTWQFRQPAVFCQCSGGGDTVCCCGESCDSLQLLAKWGSRFAPRACITPALPAHYNYGGREKMQIQEFGENWWLESCACDCEGGGVASIEQLSMLHCCMLYRGRFC